MTTNECVCRTIVTNRVGTIYVPVKTVDRGTVLKAVHRFALDCPIHGIESDRREEPVVSEAIDPAKERRDKRRAKRKRKENR